VIFFVSWRKVIYIDLDNKNLIITCGEAEVFHVKNWRIKNDK